MRGISVPMLAGLVLGVGLVCAGVCGATDKLEGREIVVRVLRRDRKNEGRLLEKVEAVIHGRKIKLEIDDVNESTDFVVCGCRMRWLSRFLENDEGAEL